MSEMDTKLRLIVSKIKELRGIDLSDFRPDPNKSFEENKKALLELAKKRMAEKKKMEQKIVNTVKKHGKMTADQIKREVAKKEAEIRKKMIEEFNRSIEQIKSNSSPEVDKYFATLKEMIKVVARGNLTGMVIYGEAGLGKTYVLLKTLGEMGLKAGENYTYISSHISPIELYNLMFKNKDRIVVVDDVEGLLNDQKILSILKSALWSSVGDKRVVAWNSPTHLLEADREFEFRGKLFLLMNKIPPKNEVLQSLLSRTLTYRLDFDHQTRLKLMYEMGKLFKIPTEVVDYLKDRYTPALENFNFRTLIQINAIHQYFAQNPPSNGVSWKTIVDELVKQNTNPVLLTVWKLMNEHASVNEMVKEFVDRTGYSRRTFFRLKKRIEEMFGVRVPTQRGVAVAPIKVG